MNILAQHPALAGFALGLIFGAPAGFMLCALFAGGSDFGEEMRLHEELQASQLNEGRLRGIIRDLGHEITR